MGRPTLSGQPPLTPALHLVSNSANHPTERVEVLRALLARGAAMQASLEFMHKHCIHPDLKWAIVAAILT